MLEPKRVDGVVAATDLQASDIDFTLLQLQSRLENEDGTDHAATLRTIGKTMAQKQRYDEAVPVYEALLALEPTSAQTQESLARCLERLGRWGEAAARYQLVVDIDPGRENAFFGLGLCMLRQDLHLAGLTAFDGCLQRNPSHVGALLGKATCLRLTGRQVDADGIYREVLRLQPELASSLDTLIGEPAIAEPATNDAAPVETSSPQPAPAGSRIGELENVIAAAVLAEDYVTAAEQCKALTEAVPDYYEAWFNLGVFEQRNANLDGAIEAFLAAVNLRPLSFEPLQALAQSHHLIGDLRSAEASYHAALVLSPDSRELLWNLGLVLEQRGDPESAEHRYSRLVKTDQDRGEVWFRLGLVRLQLGDYEGAVVAFRRALDLGARTSESDYNLGIAYWKLNRAGQAEKCFQAALKAQPDLQAAERGLAAVALHQGNFTQAHDLHRDLMERGETSVEVLFNLAVFEHRSNRLHSAIEFYKQALKTDPDLADASAGLALAQNSLSARR